MQDYSLQAQRSIHRSYGFSGTIDCWLFPSFMSDSVATGAGLCSSAKVGMVAFLRVVLSGLEEFLSGVQALAVVQLR